MADTKVTEDLLGSMKEPLTARLAELEASRTEMIERHREEMRETEDEINKLRRALKALFPEEYKPRSVGRPKKKSGPSPSKVSPKRLVEMREVVLKTLAEKDHVTQVDVRLALNCGSDTTASAFRLFRTEDDPDIGAPLLRQAGQNGNLKIYKLTALAEEHYKERLNGIAV
jgi:hypothetical protein